MKEKSENKYVQPKTVATGREKIQNIKKYRNHSEIIITGIWERRAEKKERIRSNPKKSALPITFSSFPPSFFAPFIAVAACAGCGRVERTVSCEEHSHRYAFRICCLLAACWCRVMRLCCLDMKPFWYVEVWELKRYFYPSVGGLKKKKKKRMKPFLRSFVPSRWRPTFLPLILHAVVNNNTT